MNKNEIELLAPAGSYEGFEAAIGAGADAVYVGGSMFGARAYAKNFEQEELIRAINVAHLHGKKLYLTVNTLLKNLEMERNLIEYLKPYYEAGLDAAIVQDMGVFSLIRDRFPGMHLHASTQMTVTGPEGMRFLEQQGASRVVPARELSLSELAAMHAASPIEIESFVHGALCYSYSGQCLMSSIFGGRSGNRGRCAQPCRLSYETSLQGEKYKGKKDLCPLSLKDICTIEILPEVIKAGVISLKIEGRMKQPGYTAGVTSVYRKYLDLFLEKGDENYQVSPEDKKYLLDLFNRGGSCTGYYQTKNGPSMMAFSNEKKTGDVLPQIKQKKEKLYGNLMLYPQSPAILELSCRGEKVTVSAGEVQEAKNQPMEEERIRKQMDRLGNTMYEWEKLDIRMEESIFVPVKVLNEVRREALEELENRLLAPYKRTMQDDTYRLKPVKNKKTEQPSICVSCEEEKTAHMLCASPYVNGIYLPYRLMEKCLEEGLSHGKEMYLALPHITRGEAPEGFWEQALKWLSMGMKGFLVRNLESYGKLLDMGLAKKCVLDHSMYTWNNEAIDFWRKQGVMRTTLPLELNERELAHRDNAGSEMLVYGYLPLMISAQCVRKNLYSCNGKEETLRLRDRYDKEFSAVCYCNPWKMGNTATEKPCYNIIYNSIPYGLLSEHEKVKALGVSSIRLSFTTEEVLQAEKILEEFAGAYILGRNAERREFTKGHFKRGAE